ncbi:MAG: flavodoxin family protein [Candidatus Thorarchaeota archaeon]
MVDILGISGSPRAGGNTTILVQRALDSAQEAGAKVKLVELGDKRIEVCDHIGKCYEIGECIIEDDLNNIALAMSKADGIVFGSPAYTASVPGLMKNLLDRTGRFVNLRGKVGAPLVVGRRSGMTMVVLELMFFMYVKEMIIAGTPNWPVGFSLHPGDVLGDTEAMKAAEYAGARMTELAMKLKENPVSWKHDLPHGEYRPGFGDDWR